MSITIAVVQPISSAPPADEQNVVDALAFIERAAAGGADFVAFPESYPGPWRMPMSFDPADLIAQAAARSRIYVQYGTLEPIDEEARTAYAVVAMATPVGETYRYRRTHPPGPWLYTGGRLWDFQYVAADDYPVFPTSHAVVGLALCSEVYVPEVARALALRGAELIFLPAGADKKALWATWRALIWARAIENLAVVISTQNVFGSERGLAIVAGPEAVLFESVSPGLFFVRVDLERARELRAQEDGVGAAERNGVKPGLLSQWHRPELYSHVYVPRSAPRQ